MSWDSVIKLAAVLGVMFPIVGLVITVILFFLRMDKKMDKLISMFEEFLRHAEVNRQ